MHGRKRAEYKARLSDPKLVAALSTKATQWHAVTAELLKRKSSLAAPENAFIANNNEQLNTSHDQQQQQQQQEQKQQHHSIEETLKIIEKALLVNPDPLYLWSQRRDYLLSVLPQHDHTSSLSSLFDVATEFRLTQGALERNPKAYGPWFHRKWTLQQQWCMLSLEQCQATTAFDDILQSELALSAKFLSLDERNFHGWNYRRFIVALLWNRHTPKYFQGECRLDGSMQAFLSDDPIVIMGAQTGKNVVTTATTVTSHANEDAISSEGDPASYASRHGCFSERQKEIVMAEWAFTQHKIQENFSNGSAFHHRSKLLPLLLVIRNDNNIENKETGVAITQEVILREELELVKNAMFTEPDDQTAWWYMVFLLDWATAPSRPPDHGIDVDKVVQIFVDLKTAIEELVQAEVEQTKWGLLGLHFVMDQIYQRLPVKDDDNSEELKTKMNNILNKLQSIDPDRANRCESMKLIT